MEKILGKLLGLFVTIALVRYKNKTYMFSRYGLTKGKRERTINKDMKEAGQDLKVKAEVIRLITVSEFISNGRSYPSFAQEILIPKTVLKNIR